jgi:hypothetical protein
VLEERKEPVKDDILKTLDDEDDEEEDDDDDDGGGEEDDEEIGAIEDIMGILREPEREGGLEEEP